LARPLTPGSGKKWKAKKKEKEKKENAENIDRT
jgi:hypothetical protein